MRVKGTSQRIHEPQLHRDAGNRDSSRASPPAVRLGVVSDLHHAPTPASGLVFRDQPGGPAVLARLRAAIAWFTREAVDALIIAGDLSDSGEPEALVSVLRIVADRWDGPALVVPGNHDVLRHDDALVRAVQVVRARRLSLAHPRGDRFGPLRVAGLDADVLPADATASWQDELVLVISHFPLLAGPVAIADRDLAYGEDPPVRDRVVSALLARRAPTVVIHGHLHARGSHEQASILQLGVPALVEPPFEASIIDVIVDGASVTVRRRARHMQPSTVTRPPVLTSVDETRRLPLSHSRGPTPWS